MLRGNIAATSLKILLKNLYSVKCYDKLNMNLLTLSLWENFWWGLIYFDQFRIFKQLTKTLIRLHVCAGCSEPLLVAHTALLKISCRGSNVSNGTRRLILIVDLVFFHTLCMLNVAARAHANTYSLV